jgi:hypothetical protein
MDKTAGPGPHKKESTTRLKRRLQNGRSNNR